jgi:hypothetical protein
MKTKTREWVQKAENDFTVATQILRRRKDTETKEALKNCRSIRAEVPRVLG